MSRPVTRSVQYLRRRIREVAGWCPEFSIAEVAEAYAAALGYDSWDSLRRTSSATPVQYVYDQDLPDSARHARWVAQAHAVDHALNLGFPEAFRFGVETLKSTWDLKRNESYGLGFAFYRATVDASDWWAVLPSERDYPLAPKGFRVVPLLNVAVTSRALLGRGLPGFDEGRAVALIESRPRLRYVNSGELLEIEGRLPPSVWLGPESVSTARHREIGGVKPTPGPGWKDEDIEQAWSDYLRLAWAAGESPRLQPFPVEVRDRLGKPWYWPLKPLNANLPQWGRAERRARALSEVQSSGSSG